MLQRCEIRCRNDIFQGRRFSEVCRIFSKQATNHSILHSTQLSCNEEHVFLMQALLIITYDT